MRRRRCRESGIETTGRMRLNRQGREVDESDAKGERHEEKDGHKDNRWG